MDKIKLIQTKLKPKVRQFGFTNKVFKSIAAFIADNLDLKADATEEEVETAIDTAIDEASPYFAFIQSQAGSQFDEWKKNQQGDNADNDGNGEEGGEPNTSEPANNGNRSNKPTDNGKGDNEEPAWFKTYREQQEARFKALENEKTSETRRSKLDGILKDTGTFGKRILKNYSKMNFKDEEDFEDFLADVQEDLKALNQERADKGLSAMGTPPGGKGDKSEKQTEAYSDEEIDALAD